jgi:hypothetical protein
LERYGTAERRLNQFIYSVFAVLLRKKQRSTFYN